MIKEFYWLFSLTSSKHKTFVRHSYNVGSSFSLVQHRTNVIQMFCVYWAVHIDPIPFIFCCPGARGSGCRRGVRCGAILQEPSAQGAQQVSVHLGGSRSAEGRTCRQAKVSQLFNTWITGCLVIFIYLLSFIYWYTNKYKNCTNTQL